MTAFKFNAPRVRKPGSVQPPARGYVKTLEPLQEEDEHPPTLVASDPEYTVAHEEYDAPVMTEPLQPAVPPPVPRIVMPSTGAPPPRPPAQPVAPAPKLVPPPFLGPKPVMGR
jgi:hypothetical protein